LVESTASENSLRSLDYPAVLSLLEDRCRSPYGKEAAQALRPSSHRDQVIRQQTATREMVQHRELSGNLPLALPTDIRPFLDRLSVEGARLALHAPLINLTKAEIIRRGVALGVDYSITVSCYQASAVGEACGRCDACRLRRAGFEAARVPDPTRYVPG